MPLRLCSKSPKRGDQDIIGSVETVVSARIVIFIKLWGTRRDVGKNVAILGKIDKNCVHSVWMLAQILAICLREQVIFMSTLLDPVYITDRPVAANLHNQIALRVFASRK